MVTRSQRTKKEKSVSGRGESQEFIGSMVRDTCCLNNAKTPSAGCWEVNLVRLQTDVECR